MKTLRNGMFLNRVGAFGIVLALAAAAVSGCTAPKPEESHAPVTIQFWEWFGGAWVDQYQNEVELFEEEYPWITVKVSDFPDQTAYREALTAAFDAGKAPDAFARRHAVPAMIADGWIQPIDPWITDEWLGEFPADSFLSGRNKYDGAIYSFPSYATKFERMIYINDELFEQAGLTASGDVTRPETWSDLRSMAADITEAGAGESYGIGLGMKDPRQAAWWFDVAGLAGAPGGLGFDYRTGEYVYGSDPGYEEIINLLLDLKADGSVYPAGGSIDDSNAYQYFGQGAFAMMLSGSYTAANLTSEFPDLSFTVIPLPVPDEGRSGGLALEPGQVGMYYMNAQTDHPDDTWLWLDWLSSRAFGERMVAAGLDFSVYSDLNTAQVMGDLARADAYEAATTYLMAAPYPAGGNSAVLKVLPEPVTPDVGDIIIGAYTGQIPDWHSALVDLDLRKQAALESAIDAVNAGGDEVSIGDYTFPDWNPMTDYEGADAN